MGGDGGTGGSDDGAGATAETPPEDDADVENCNKCGKDTLPSNQLLLCDGEGCSRAFHQKCLSPPLDEVPEGEWLCPRCVDSTKGAVAA